MSSRLPTWHTYTRRVHRIHACVATNRLLTANILKSIAPIRTRKRDFLSTYNYATSTSAVTVLFATASAVAVTALKKNGKHSQWAAYGKSTDWGYFIVLCYSPIAQQTAHIIAAEKAIEPTTKINIQIQAATITSKNLSVINCIQRFALRP